MRRRDTIQKIFPDLIDESLLPGAARELVPACVDINSCFAYTDDRNKDRDDEYSDDDEDYVSPIEDLDDDWKNALILDEFSEGEEAFGSENRKNKSGFRLV